MRQIYLWTWKMVKSIFFFFFCLSLFWCQTKAGVNMTIIILTSFKDILMLYSSNVMNLKDFWCLFISFPLKSIHSVLYLLVCTFNFKILKRRLKFLKDIDFYSCQCLIRIKIIWSKTENNSWNGTMSLPLRTLIMF